MTDPPAAPALELLATETGPELVAVLGLVVVIADYPT